MPTIDRLQLLKELQLHGMAIALSELLAEHPRSSKAPEIWVDRLIEAEITERKTRSLRYQLHAANTISYNWMCVYNTVLFVM